jgi:uncharacterized protein (UPF0332 family)
LLIGCFYSVLALFTHKGIRIKTHDGVKNIFNRDYIKTEILPTHFGKFYSNLFSKRQESDYQEMKKFTKEEIEPLISKAEEFIQTIKSLVILIE